MKKLPLGLVAISALSLSIYFVSCKKETAEPPQELPAIQMIRQAVSEDWEIGENSLMKMDVTFKQKLKPEFVNFATDTTVALSVWVRFKGETKDVLLPYVAKSLDGSKYYFYSMAGGKPAILFHNTNVCDFKEGGTASAAPIEQISFNFTKIDFE